MSTTTLAALERIASPARNAFVDLEYWLYTSASQRLDAIEVEQECRGREVFRLMLQAHICSRGDGDVGQGLTVRPPGCPGAILYRHKRLRSRGLVTVFGAVSVTRMEYSSPGQPNIYLTPGGTLVIPFEAPERYLWWMPGGKRLRVKEIMAEVLGRMEMGKVSDGTGI